MVRYEVVHAFDTGRNVDEVFRVLQALVSDSRARELAPGSAWAAFRPLSHPLPATRVGVHATVAPAAALKGSGAPRAVDAPQS